MAANVRKIRTFLKQNVTPLVPAARIRVRRLVGAPRWTLAPEGSRCGPSVDVGPPEFGLMRMPKMITLTAT